MLSKEIAELMQLIQRDNARTSEKIKSEGPAIKGLLNFLLDKFF